MANPRIQFPFEPRPHQRDAHKASKRFTVLVWHRRAGKTVYAVMKLLLAAALCTRPMGEFGIIAPKLKQAKKNAWKYLKYFARAVPGIVINESELYVQFPFNQAKVRLYGADDPDSIRGDYFDGVVLDEVAQMKAEVWGEIVRPMLSDRLGWCLFIGTPKGLNLFSEMYNRALAEEGETWHADLRRWNDTNALERSEVELMRREMTEAQFKQEMECDFSAAVENALLDLYTVKDAMERDADEASYAFAPRVLGVDVARCGGDRVALFPRQGVLGRKPIAFHPASLVGRGALMQVAARVAEFMEAWRPHATFIDAGGVGAGVCDRLDELGYKITRVDFGGKPSKEKYNNKRSEMWSKMADWVADGGCLPNVHELIADLTAPTYSFLDGNGKFALESKDDIKERLKRSPDLGDALALTFAMDVPQPDLSDVLPGAKAERRRARMTTNPLEAD